MIRREEIEQQAKSYTLAVFDELDDFSDVTQAYIDGAEWMQETMIEKACEWLTNNWREYVYQDGDGIVHFGHWQSDFCKAMEE